jgi:hypothetical protein
MKIVTNDKWSYHARMFLGKMFSNLSINLQD